MIIETKYNIGDEVYILSSNKVKKVKVIGILITKGAQRNQENYVIQEIRYNLYVAGAASYEGFLERSIFKTKEELLESL